MKAKKTKGSEPSLREKLSAKFLEAFQSDFEEYGVAAIQTLREKYPERYAELAGKLIMAAEPVTPGGYAACQSTAEVARKLLVDCGANEYAIDDEMIEEAIKESDRHVEELGRIASRAVQ